MTTCHFIAQLDFISTTSVIFPQQLLGGHGGKLPGACATLKQRIELGVCAVLRLRKAKESPDQTQQTDAGPEEASFGAPRPRTRIQLARHQNVADYGSDVVGIPGKDNALLPETCRRNLSNETVCHRPDGAIVDKGTDDQERAYGPPRRLVRCWGQSRETNDSVEYEQLGIG